MDPGKVDGTIMIAVLGWDEKFLGRCMMRIYTQGGLQRVLLIIPSAPDETSKEKVENAYTYLEKLAKDYIGAQIERVNVPHGSFMDAFLTAWNTLLKALEEGSSVTICLSGGMRYAVAALLAAAIALPQDHPGTDKVRAEVDLESGRGHVEIPLNLIRHLACAPSSHHKVLAALAGGKPRGITELAKELEMPKSTIHKILDGLREKGLVEKRNGKYVTTITSTREEQQA